MFVTVNNQHDEVSIGTSPVQNYLYWANSTSICLSPIFTILSRFTYSGKSQGATNQRQSRFFVTRLENITKVYPLKTDDSTHTAGAK